MNIIQIRIKLFRHYWQKRKEVLTEKHCTKIFYKALDLAIQKCIQHPRKYYIAKKSLTDWEILGSQELKKLKKFPGVRKDIDFMEMAETAFIVQPENLERLKHEQYRRRWHIQWKNLFWGNYYTPVTKKELEMLKKIRRNIDGLDRPFLNVELNKFIKKHE